MNIHEIDISKEKLLAMGQNERVFFIYIAHFLNELHILLRCITSTDNIKPSSDVEKHAMTIQYLFFLRILASKLYECNAMFDKKLYGTALSRELEPKFSKRAKEIRKELKKYFKKKKNLKILRNDFGFHYDAKELETGLNKLLKVEKESYLKIFITNNWGNWLHLFSDVVMFSTVRESLPSNSKKDFDFPKLEKEITDVAGLFQEFGIECLKVVAKDFLLQDCKEYDIPDPPHYNDVALPCFMIGEPIKPREVKATVTVKATDEILKKFGSEKDKKD